MNAFKLWRACLIVFVYILSARAQSSVVFDSTPFMQGGFTYSGGLSTRVAFPFRPTQSGSLESIEVPLFLDGGVNEAEIQLIRDAFHPGGLNQLLEQFSANGRMPTDPQADYAAITFQSSTHPFLNASEEYWIALVAPSNARVDWSASATQIDSYFWTGSELLYDPPGGPSWKSGAFRVTVVPEPTTALLIVSGVAAIALGTWIRRS